MLIVHLIVAARRQPSRVLVLFIARLCFEVAFQAALTWLAHPVLGELAWRELLAARR